MGTVFKAQDNLLDRCVALKRLHGLDPDAPDALRLLREARLAAQLDHQNIVVLHDV